MNQTDRERIAKDFTNLMDKFRYGPFKSSLEYYLDTGKVSGNLLIALEEYSTIRDKQLEELRAELEKEKGKLTVIEVKYAAENAELKAAKEDLLNMINEIRGALYARDTSDDIWHALDKIFSKTEFKYDAEDFE